MSHVSKLAIFFEVFAIDANWDVAGEKALTVLHLKWLEPISRNHNYNLDIGLHIAVQKKYECS